MRYVSRTIAVITLIMRDAERKHLMLAAAGLAYYFLMSLFPALVLLAAGVAYLPLHDGLQELTSFLVHVMPPQGLSIIENILATIGPHRSELLSFGIIATLWLASIGGKGVIASLDIAYGVSKPRPIWINRILACGLTLIVGVLMLLGVCLTVAGPRLRDILATFVPVESLWPQVWPYLQWCLSALFIFAAIELLYILAPNVDPVQRLTIPGALVAAGTWMALAWGLGFYFHYFGTLKLHRFYGILASPVAFMIWLYCGAGALILGAQVNASLREQSKSEVTGKTETQRP
jgi:membrane protein